ncbi:hypothetical protein [Desulfovibrio sp.]|uniref:hypothetical protein n=1 Tax=Desulfovibrio sp. TaxID=885 RepID=UPI0025B850EF|nr:hypothetical protein [Desulfovibrio sp.]
MGCTVKSVDGDILGVLPDSLVNVGQAVETFSAAGSRTEAVLAGTPWSVPAYPVGADRLEVFLDGLACVGGNDSATAQYAEVGVSGETSSEIVFHDDIAPDMDVLVRLK